MGGKSTENAISNNNYYIRVPLTLWQDKRLTPAEKHAMYGLIWHGNNKSKAAWPKQETLAQECGLTRKFIGKTLKKLHDLNYITVTGKRNRRKYKINQISKSEEVSEEWKHSTHEVGTSFPLSENEELSSGYSVHTECERNTHRLSQTNSEMNDIQEPFSDTENKHIKRSIEHKPLKNNNEKNVPKTNTCSTETIQDAELEKEFESLWEMYPRKEGRSFAWVNYCKQRRAGASFEEIRKGLLGYKAKLKAECTQYRYIKAGSTFFGPALCWKDYLNTSVNVNVYAGFAEPSSGDEFRKDNELIKNHFGGDTNAYVTWILDKKPEPISEWYANYIKVKTPYKANDTLGENDIPF